MRSRNLAVICCVGLLASCGQEGAAGNTQIDLTIGTEPGTTSEELAFEADRVDYRITCVGTDPGTLPIPLDSTSGDYVYDDSIDISGALEIVDDQDELTPPVWTTVTDLPPGDCTATLSVYRNGSIVCDGSQDFTVVEDNTTMLSITLVCSLSVDTPDADGDADGGFQFEVGNECPKIFNLAAIPRVIPNGQSSALIQTLALDLDGTCGSNCNPQTCDDANPPVCTPGPDNGFVTTLDAFVGTFDDPSSTLTTYHCDPWFPGLIEICTNVSDGDLDCDKERCTSLVCPDPCEGVVCDDGNECTAESCDPQTGTCQFDVAPDGIACDSCNSTCQAGVCDPGAPFIAAQNGSIMPFVGNYRLFGTAYANPYSDFYFVLPVSLVFYNNTTYKGVGLNDTITGTPSGDYLLLNDPFRGFPQSVCGVETFLAGSGGDFAHFADLFINTIPMTFQGHNANDVIWANSGDDFLDGGNGNDLLDGGPGNDVILGGNGMDHITMGHDNGVDSVFGGTGFFDDMSVNALASQITILPAANGSYEFDIFYNGTWIAQIVQIEEFFTMNAMIDLTACVAGVCNLCGDGVLNGGEECDDGNLIDGDSCPSNCIIN
jgi:cysteine-rich repeat protein